MLEKKWFWAFDMMSKSLYPLCVCIGVTQPLARLVSLQLCIAQYRRLQTHIGLFTVVTHSTM